MAWSVVWRAGAGHRCDRVFAMVTQLTLPWSPSPAPISDLHDLRVRLESALTIFGSTTTVAIPGRSVVLDWTLSMSDVDAAHAWAVACSGWQAEVVAGGLTQQTADKYSREARLLIAYASDGAAATVADAADAAEAWIFSPVRRRGVGAREAADSTVHVRHAVVQALFVQLRAAGLTLLRPAIDIDLPQRGGGRSTRPLLTAEADRCQAHADGMSGTRTPVTFALASCGAGTGEIGLVVVDDVDLIARTVWLPGTSRTDPRLVRIPDWEHEVIAARIAELTPLEGVDPLWEHTTHLAHSSRAGTAGIQSSISMTLGELLRRTGLRDPDIRPSSVQAWAARQVFDATRDIAETAQFLGVPGLDLAAQTIGWDWSTHAPPSRRRKRGPGLVR